ncbi:MAG: META domain-containing protein [Desulfobulbaceae bacterium]|nr:META domain-containing protein [Desulfobulbaceae bacterium]
MRTSFFFSIVLAIILAACSGHQNIPVEQKTAPAGALCPIQTPATFSGEIPCADCAGILITLNLRSDSIYQLRKTYLGTEDGDKAVAEMGRWRFVADGNFIILGQKKSKLHTFAIKDQDTLRLLDSQGQEIPSKLNYDLKLADQLDSFQDSVAMKGMYRYMADAAIFTDCLSKVSFPVAIEGDSVLLERAYTSTPHGKAEPLLVTFKGKISMRPKMEGVGEQEVVVVDRFDKIIPNKGCAGSEGKIGLIGTHWKLIQLSGDPVKIEKGRKEPFFLLQAKDNNLLGFGGCNRFFGTYLIKGEVFVFNKMASTRMACPSGMAVENLFLKALGKTEAYRIEDDLLTLLDRDETELAVLRAAQ